MTINFQKIEQILQEVKNGLNMSEKGHFVSAV